MTVIALAAGTGISSSGTDIAGKTLRTQDDASVMSTAATPTSDGSSFGLRSLDVLVPDSMSGTPRSPTAAGVAATTASDPCRAARGAVRYYRAAYVGWRSKVGAGEATSSVRGKRVTPAACPRYLAKLLRTKARTARLAYVEWREYHWAYWRWMPAFWRAIAICESGQNPPNWNHDSGPYVSAFGITVAEYDADAAYFDAPPWRVRHTPRDEYLAARGHQARFGLGGWGCYTNGGYLYHMP